jgi:hypothetical protein
MGEQDPLWVVNDEVVRQISNLLSGVEGSSVAIVKDAGHAIDFHKVGPQFQDDQLAFALDCARQ